MKKGKSSRELFEKVRVNAVFFFDFGILGGFVGLYRKGAERKVPEFIEFSMRILLQKMLRKFPESFEDFSCFVCWETETTKNSPKPPPFFNAKSPGREKDHKSFWRAGKVRIRGVFSGKTSRIYKNPPFS